MRRRWIWAAALIGGLATIGETRAHDGHEHEPADAPHLTKSLRTWTHASGRTHVRGSFVAMNGDQVQIRREEGGLLDIKLQALSEPDRDWVRERRAQIERINQDLALLMPAQRPAAGPPPAMLAHFQPFADKLTLGWDKDYFYVESDGIPDHKMMVGITAWQQQVPLPQPYRGGNAWQIPLHPVPAKQPMSAKENFFRGAIALAVNGVPIFNPIKNDGRTDTLLAGELDEFGGHCGRADDYHYHIAPVHLEPKTGKGKPLAYALDGYPIYGYDEPDGSKAARLDAFNGHETPGGSYHYHATKTYPYLNGGFHGEVTERGGQVDPQPRAEPVREALPPLRGARITGFETLEKGSHRLTYDIRGAKHFVHYTEAGDGSVTFRFVDAQGRTTTETYQRRGPRQEPPARPGGRGEEPGRRAPREPGRRPPRVMSALDKDQDGMLSPAEIAAAPQALLSLDRDRDGRVTEEELRPEAPPEDDRPPQPEGRRGPDPNDPNRRPWIQVHAPEMDANRDGALTRAELLAETDATFAGYDRDKNNVLSRDEYEGGGGVRSPMGGFLKQHAAELDTDGDGKITRDELRANATRMFDRADRNRDGTLDAAELQATDQPRQPGGEGRGRGEAAPGGQRPRPQERTKGQRNAGGARANARQTDASEPPPFHTQVPDHPIDVILGRPTDHSVTLSLVAYQDAEGVIAYGPRDGALSQKSAPFTLPAGRPVEVVLDGLQGNSAYEYRVDLQNKGRANLAKGEIRGFHTQRAPGQPFRFTVQADSHLDLGMKPELYVRTLENALAAGPDFHFELGDTFMTDKFARHTDAITQYRAQRYYFGLLCHSASLFFVLGNHDGETGARLDGTDRSMPVWSARTRKTFLPNPYPDAFYTGNGDEKPFVGKLGDYYAWTWGDALFIVLDPFWYTTVRRVQGDDYWGRTLGEAQYRWLTRTLESSRAKYTFVFIHHLVGGATREARGGVEAAPFFEWGGRDLDGTPSFDRHRPGWGKPIHDLLVRHGVSAVFHGHDHFYAHQELDGVVYQLVPQPGNPRQGTPRSAEEYGYRAGDLRNGPGHLRVSVGPEKAEVAYVLSVLPGEERGDRQNARVITSYSIPAGRRDARRP